MKARREIPPCGHAVNGGTGRERFRDLLHYANGDLKSLDASSFERKVEAQRSIIKSGEDVRILRKAMKAFRSLQHVQILRLQDEADGSLLEHINENGEDFTRLVDLRWTLACTHAARTVGEALSYADSPFSRFSGPMMNAQSALAFKDTIPKALDFLAERLTCLELHFADGPLSDRMVDLSGVFKHVFSAARNMQAVHIGFPSRRPLDLPLETLFNNVQWEKLRAFGIQAWRLDAEEIINLARRHRKTLRGLRLRDVLLREGSLWKDVLCMLREEMELLEWVSLRRIDYSNHFDDTAANSMEVTDFDPGSGSNSDEEDNWHARVGTDDEEEDDDDDDGWDAISDDRSVADSDQGPEANDIALSPDTPASLPFCTCSWSSYPATADDLGDNGRAVIPQQRKLWEKWVIGRCPEHSSS